MRPLGLQRALNVPLLKDDLTYATFNVFGTPAYWQADEIVAMRVLALLAARWVAPAAGLSYSLGGDASGRRGRAPHAGRLRRSAMPVSALDHFTIRCSEADLEPLREFYTRVVGLRVGDRPPIPAPGFWLYSGGRPIVHLYAIGRTAGARGGGRPGPLDHISFRAQGLEARASTCAPTALPSTSCRCRDWPLHQIFLHDPTGLKIELTFDLDAERERRMAARVDLRPRRVARLRRARAAARRSSSCTAARRAGRCSVRWCRCSRRTSPSSPTTSATAARPRARTGEATLAELADDARR